ncbi:MAG TPA: transcription antitermination protein NusB [Solirubrobacteraceae bacterium]
MRRSDQRRAAVVALYQHDLTGRPLVETLGPNASLFARALAHAAADRCEELDQVIDRHAHGWSVQRIQPLERSIMRVALIEMLHPDVAPGDTPIPAAGAIEEAVESAKTFCGSEAPAFVNGVLGAVLREVRENGKPSENSPDRVTADPEEKSQSFRIASKPII